MGQQELRDDQWTVIEPFVPGGCKGRRGPRSNWADFHQCSAMAGPLHIPL